jgi:hypothetical protein
MTTKRMSPERAGMRVRAVVIALLGCMPRLHLSNPAGVKPENANGGQPASELGSVA